MTTQTKGDRIPPHHRAITFPSQRARRDIQTPVAFLTTRVKKPDEDDWGKLRRLLKYLKGTKYMKLTLQVDDLSMVKWADQNDEVVVVNFAEQLKPRARVARKRQYWRLEQGEWKIFYEGNA